MTGPRSRHIPNHASQLSKMLLVFVVLGSSLGCGMKAETASGGSSGGDGGSSSTSFKLKLTVSSFYETSSIANATVLGTCSATTTTTSVPKASCIITVPEGQLFYSKLSFTIETDSAATCTQIGFRPYYYLMSKSAGFSTPGTTTAGNDCSGVLWQTDPDCWNGPGKDYLGTTLLQPGGGVYSIVSSTDLSETYTMASSPNGKYGSLVSSNRYYANDYATPTVSVATGSDPYEAGAGDCGTSSNNPATGECYFDWYFDCRDIYNELQYSITAQIVEADGTTNSFLDWTP